MASWILYFDGACMPKNPGGIATYGWVLYSPDGNLVDEGKGFVCEGNEATNNKAEFAGLIAGLNHFKKSGLSGPILCKGDSKLVVELVAGRWKAKKDHIIELRNQSLDLLSSIRSPWNIKWIPRELNQEADELSHCAYIDRMRSKSKRII